MFTLVCMKTYGKENSFLLENTKIFSTNGIKEFMGFVVEPLIKQNGNGRSFLSQETVLRLLREFAEPVKSYIYVRLGLELDFIALVQSQNYKRQPKKRSLGSTDKRLCESNKNL